MPSAIRVMPNTAVGPALRDLGPAQLVAALDMTFFRVSVPGRGFPVPANASVIQSRLMRSIYRRKEQRSFRHGEDERAFRFRSGERGID